MGATPFVAEISIFAFNFAPRGWAFCDGQLLPISQNTALFSLLGTMYGGDGKSTFALPNMQGRTANSLGQDPVWGADGEEVVTGTLPTTALPTQILNDARTSPAANKPTPRPAASGKQRRQ